MIYCFMCGKYDDIEGDMVFHFIFDETRCSIRLAKRRWDNKNNFTTRCFILS